MTNEKILQAYELLDVARVAIERASIALRNLPDHNEYVLEVLARVNDVNAMILMDLHRSTEELAESARKIKEG